MGERKVAGTNPVPRPIPAIVHSGSYHEGDQKGTSGGETIASQSEIKRNWSLTVGPFTRTLIVSSAGLSGAALRAGDIEPAALTKKTHSMSCAGLSADFAVRW
jgi:hypothetical protein